MDYYATFDKRTGKPYDVDLGRAETPVTGVDGADSGAAVEPLGYRI